MLEIVLNILIGLLILFISWKSTAFKRKTLLHIIVGILVIGLGIYNGVALYQKEDKILDLNELTNSLRIENKELITGQNTMIEQMDTLIFVIDTLTLRLEPFAKFALQKYPDKELDEALEMLQEQFESTIQRVTSIEDGTKQRLITTEQERILIDSLFLIKELSKIYISYDASDLESRNYGSQFYLKSFLLFFGLKIVFALTFHQANPFFVHQKFGKAKNSIPP